MAARTFHAEYTRFEGSYARPYLNARIGIGSLRSHQMPMIVDTGADACFIDHRLAYSIGINPVDGGAIGSVWGLSEESPTARYPVDLYLSEFDLSFRVDVFFAILESPGMNGLLGHEGFLDRFRRVSFIPGRILRAGAALNSSRARAGWTIESGEDPKVLSLDDLRERCDSRDLGTKVIDRRVESVYPNRPKPRSPSALDI